MIIRLSKAIGDGDIDWNRPQSTPTCAKTQEYLNSKYGVQLVIRRSHGHSDIYYTGEPRRPVGRQINLILHNNHLSLITNPLSYFSVKQCQGCFSLFKGRHSFCPKVRMECFKCSSSSCDSKEPSKRGDRRICTKCQGYFFTKLCYENHLSRKSKDHKPPCLRYIFCPICGKKLARDESEAKDGMTLSSHGCLLSLCQQCGNRNDDLRQGRRHLCTLQKAKLPELGISKNWADRRGIVYKSARPQKDFVQPSAEHLNAEKVDLEREYFEMVPSSGIVAYDFETRCDSSRTLRPYLATALFMCTKCAFTDPFEPSRWKETYECCGVRKRRYVGPSGMREFILDLFFRKRHKRSRAFSFNGSSFDNLFILNTLIQNGSVPQIKMKGRKIMQFMHNGVTLKDLRFFLSGSLAAIPKNFKFEHIVEKG